MTLSLARLYAWEILESQRKRDAYVRDLFVSHQKLQSLSDADRAFTYRLVVGVVATRGVLDELLRICAHKPSSIKASVKTALFISLFELCFLEKEVHAAIHQGVLLAAHANRHARSFANACLRSAANIQEEFFAEEKLSSLEREARRVGFPAWILKRIEADYGTKFALSYLEDLKRPAQVYLIPNELRYTREKFLSLCSTYEQDMRPYILDSDANLTWLSFEQNGVCQEPIRKTLEARKSLPPHICAAQLGSARLVEDSQIKELLKDHNVLVSDIAAQQVALWVVAELLRKDSKQLELLEIGAGRGTKTIQIQAMCQNFLDRQIAYDTLDIHEFKKELLHKRMKASGASVQESFVGDATMLQDCLPHDKGYDLIFIDAPCSGLGTLGRHPEIIWSIKPDEISSLARIQLAMLKSASLYLKDGGSIVYSTCSLLREENEQVVAEFLASKEAEGLKLVASRYTHLNEAPSDYHFVALLRQEV